VPDPVSSLPLPPLELANLSGWLLSRDDSFERYESVGRDLRDAVVRALPEDWSWSGKRVLDFGCGAGRVLRHFVPEAGEAEFWGCDIDAPSVNWVNANLDPPLRAFVNAERPPLPRADDSFDLVYAFSVFSHLTDAWSAWLLELHRVLAPEGVLVASFLGAGMVEVVAGEPWSEDRIGMNVLNAYRSWDRGGPNVLLSPWWIREHWGRAFEIEHIDDGGSYGTHGMVVARPKPEPPDRAELERINTDDPRELAALKHNIDQVGREAASADAQLERTIQGYETSLSWRATAPLRRLRIRTRPSGR
jgi:SAM-dependent methyltransferase